MLLFVGMGMLGHDLASAQVMARPGWAGSGVKPEPWWTTAVIYRLDPARFQDSDGDGVGDLAGVAQRLDYLQSLGVDAILLNHYPGSRPSGAAGTANERRGGTGGFNAAPDPGADAGLDDLVRAASNHHLRILITVSPELQNGPLPDLLGLVHGWLSLGVAGVWLPQPPLAVGADAAASEAHYVAVREALRAVLHAMPGERLLLADPAPDAEGHSSASRSARAESPVALTTAVVVPTQPPNALALRSGLASLQSQAVPGRVALLRFADRPSTGSPDIVAEAALLLGSGGAVFVDAGDEIGLDLSDRPLSGRSNGLPVMQWTPTNVQRPAAAPIERRPAPSGPVYGAYRPYIHPPPMVLTGPAPAAPRAAIDGNIPAALPDPNTLLGFTSGQLPAPPEGGDGLNVAAEERDPQSTLAAFRQLISLHHGNPAIRSGAEIVLATPEPGTVVWFRRRPASSVTGSDVLGAVNLGDQAVTLNLDIPLSKVGMRPGTLRALFTHAAAPLTGESTTSLRLPPHSAYLGEWTRTRSGLPGRRGQ